MRALLFILVLTGCASLLDDSDYARIEQPEVANRCVAWLLGEDVRPLPYIVYVEDMPWLPEFGFVSGYYSPDHNTIVIHRQFNQGPILRHELTHVYGATESEARSVARRGADCVNFGGV